MVQSRPHLSSGSPQTGGQVFVYGTVELKVLDINGKRVPSLGQSMTSKCKQHGFSSDLEDVVLGRSVDTQMEHGLSGHLETVL